MSRLGATDRIEVAPTNNVYTVLAAVGCVVALLAIFVLITRANDIIPPGILK